MKKVFSAVLAILLLISVLPTAALASSSKTIYISSTGSGTMNLRSGPGKGYDVKGYVHHGDKVSVLDKSGEWSKVKTSSGKTGWIKTKYIDGTTKALGTGKKTVKVPSGETLNLRSGPGTGYSVKGSVKNGATVKVLNTEDDWVKVTVSSSGKTGWIKAKYIGGSASSGSGSSGKSGSSKSGGSSTQSVYRVSGASLNVRKGAGTGYGVVTSLPAGTAFKVTGSSGNWYRIATFGGVTGWVSKNYAASGASASVTASSLNMRSGAGTGYRVVRSLGYGARVTVSAVTGGWAKVSYGGNTGYVSLKYLRF